MRAGISNRNEMAAGLIRAHHLLRAVEKILLENVGFERAAGLAGNDKKSPRNIDLAFDRLDLRRIGRVEYVKIRVPGGFAKGHAQHFRAQARSAHAEQKHIFKTRAPHLFRQTY